MKYLTLLMYIGFMILMIDFWWLRPEPLSMEHIKNQVSVEVFDELYVELYREIYKDVYNQVMEDVRNEFK